MGPRALRAGRLRGLRRITFGYLSGAADDGEDPAVRAALDVLARHTSTPDRGYAAVWEGWSGARPPPVAPWVEILGAVRPATYGEPAPLYREDGPERRSVSS